ncbi:30S ribosomal protein S14 [Plantactinospora sp. CA-290183]|uniref:30S ribosomal protein S14 n=1 Tax=Plantactinospora sp. CA-290183 TaxID=3240006 RepID=UPI003D8E00F0
MARRALTGRDQRRAVLVARHTERRTALRKLISDPRTASGARAEALHRLAALPRDSSPVRRRNRDLVDGRPRGFLRRFGLSRVRFRGMALRGELPGVRKASR